MYQQTKSKMTYLTRKDKSKITINSCKKWDSLVWETEKRNVGILIYLRPKTTTYSIVPNKHTGRLIVNEKYFRLLILVLPNKFLGNF